MIYLLRKILAHTDWKKVCEHNYSGIQWYPEYKKHSFTITKNYVKLDSKIMEKKEFVRTYNLSITDAEKLGVTYEYYTQQNSLWYGNNKIKYIIYKNYHIIDLKEGIAICQLNMPTSIEWFKVYKIPNNYCIWNKEDLIQFIEKKGRFMCNKKFVLNEGKYVPFIEKHIPTIRPNYCWNIPCRLLTLDGHYLKIHAIIMKEKD